MSRVHGPERLYAFADSLGEDETARAAHAKQEQQLETWVLFKLAEETFGFPVTATREIVRVQSITRVPHAPFPIRGIINLHGRVVPVVDLLARLGLPTSEPGPSNRILIVSARRQVLGFLVDSVEHVARIDLNTVTQPPADVMTEQSEYIVGVCHLGDTLAILLDFERVLLIPDSLRQAS